MNGWYRVHLVREHHSQRGRDGFYPLLWSTMIVKSTGAGGAVKAARDLLEAANSPWTAEEAEECPEEANA